MKALNMTLRNTVLAAAVLFSLPSIGQECAKPRGTLRISATGDILVHKALFSAVIRQRSRFVALWSKMIPTLQKADLAVGNLEGPVAPGVVAGGKAVRDVGFIYDDRVYSGTNFVFNYHPFVLEDLARSGFDLITTANNHSMDRNTLGADRTIEEIEKSPLAFVGTRKSHSNELRGRIVRVKSSNIGVIACTEALNGMPDPYGQVLLCSSSEVTELISLLKERTDGVIVFPHWGYEYQPNPNKTQRSWAKKWIKAGALAVIGNHPHVLQTTEWITRPNGQNGLVIYSLGNFVAAQGAMEKRVSAIAHLDLVPTRKGLEISQFSYTPIVRPSGSLSLSLLNSKSAEARHVRNQLGDPSCR